MKKILLSIATLGVLGAAVVGGTTAIFSDAEVSTGNTFTAGAIDLTIDNESYYNGVLNDGEGGTTWLQPANLDDGQGPGENGAYFFFDFRDLKPGDWGEDTISLHVNNNDSWLCADVTLRSDADNGSTEPELNDEESYTADDGELAEAVDFIWWADDGDNVLEKDEEPLPSGPLGYLDVDETATVALADASGNIWEESGPLLGDSVRYIGKAWCFGELTLTPFDQDGLGKEGTDSNPSTPNGPTVRGAGFDCDGSQEDNSTQTDSMTADISFRAEQSRHNGDFLCTPPEQEERGTLTVIKDVVDGNAQIEDFDLFVSGEPVVSGVGEAFPANTLLTVTETDDSGLYVASFSGNCDSNGEITLSSEQDATCTVTNTYTPVTLTVDKRLDVTTGGIDAGDFQLHIVGPDVDQIVTDEDPTTDLPAGDYTVYEVLIGDAVGVEFETTFGGSCNSLGEITLAPGDDLTCEILNREIN